MTSNLDKLWLQDSLNQAAIARVKDAIGNLGQSLPCRVVAINQSLVTVAFEVNAAPLTLPQITIPKAESPWIRMPTQVGDLGITIPADVYIASISGQSTGTPDMTPPGNLSALVFLPVSNLNSPPIDLNAAQVQGPNGVILKTTTGTTCSVILNTSGITCTYGSTAITMTGSSLSLQAGGKTVTLNSSGLTIDGILFDTHVHGGVTSGSSFTIGPS